MIDRLFPIARRELLKALVRYDKERPGLGDRFLERVQAAIQEIVENPGRFPKVMVRRSGVVVRRQVVKRFPYGIYFETRKAMIVIIAFAHHNRRPGYWKGRRA